MVSHLIFKKRNHRNTNAYKQLITVGGKYIKVLETSLSFKYSEPKPGACEYRIKNMLYFDILSRNL